MISSSSHQALGSRWPVMECYVVRALFQMIVHRFVAELKIV